jgi:hypothetical protein
MGPFMFGGGMPNFIRIEIPGGARPSAQPKMSRKKAAEILGVPINAKKRDIKDAYNKLVLIWHPDKHPPEKRAKATEKFKQINEAKEVLSKPAPATQQPRGPQVNPMHFANRVFEDFLFGGLHPEMDPDDPAEPRGQEDLDTEAEDMLRFLNRANRPASNPDIFVFGPDQPPPTADPPAPTPHVVEKTKKEMLHFRVHIDLIDTWKNTQKELPLQQHLSGKPGRYSQSEHIPKTKVRLPLYYREVTFLSDKQDIHVRLRDKTHPQFRRVGDTWDLEAVADISLGKLYTSSLLRVTLPDGKEQLVRWPGKEGVEKLYASIEKGFLLPGLGLPKPPQTPTPTQSEIDRGDMLVRLRILLPKDLAEEKVIEDEENKDAEKKENVLDPVWIEEQTWRQRWTPSTEAENGRSTQLIFEDYARSVRSSDS